MTPSPSTLSIVRGTRELRRLLRQAVDLRGLDLEGFRHWLTHQLPFWESDTAFVQRVSIRDLRRAHPELRALERACRHAAAADEASPHAARLLQVEEELTRSGKAIAGLGTALERAEPEAQPGLRRKLEAFQDRQQALQREQEQLTRESPPRQELLRLRAELQQLRSRLGLERAEAALAELLLNQGRRSVHAGGGFEQQALALTWQHIVPELVRTESTARLRVLTGVGLGAARTELDQLLIRQPRRAGEPVEVLALVEVKRNLNDLAHGFRRRQENLAWFTGDERHYEPLEYRTRHFRSGHFDREAVHEQDGERFVFAPGSFHHFRREPGPGPFLRRLYFITRTGTLAGVSTAALARIRHRVATDERWRLQDDASLRELLRWCQSLAEPLETPDVLRLYCSVPGRARQVLVASR
ncbi:OmpH family outer membrane protein [Archangium gephyra]|uniref:OmpH family outer membrane protein n=1 Tax=Archangium gephyra TaxID=48 RepID=UPI0035D47D4D